MQTVLTPKPAQKIGLRTSPAHLLEATSKEECWGESAHTAEPFINRNVSESLFREFDFCPQWPTKTWHSDWTTWFKNHFSSWWNKVGKKFFFCILFYPPHIPTNQSIFCIELRRKSPSDLSPGLKGRGEKIYLYNKVKAQTHRFICWSSHSALSFSRQLLVYYQYLISI